MSQDLQSINSEQLLNDIENEQLIDYSDDHNQQSDQIHFDQNEDEQIYDLIDDQIVDNQSNHQPKSQDYDHDHDQYSQKHTRLKKTKKIIKEKNKKTKKTQDPDLNDLHDYEPDYDEIEKIKKTKKKKKTDDQFSKWAEIQAQQLIDFIESSFKMDQNLNLAKQPAINRLKCMTELEKKLKNRLIQNQFLNFSGLDSLEKYLTSMPDGSQPSSLLKLKVLELLRLLKLDSHHVRTTQLGQKVMQIQEDKNETGDIKKIASELIDKWTRMIMDNQYDYKKQQFQITDKLKYKGLIQQEWLSQKAYQKQKNIQYQQSKKLLPPEERQFYFYVNPQNTIKETYKPQLGEEAKRIYKVLGDLKKSSKKK